MIQRVSELTSEPEVGRFYLVPCVIDVYFDKLPIYGPPHSDKEYIGFEPTHYHLDARFLAMWQIKEASRGRHCGDLIATALNRVLDVRYVMRQPVEMKMKCKRRMPDFPVGIINNTFYSPWFLGLQRAHTGKSAKCGTCPHRGFNLKGLPVKDGKVICPGHGLAWDTNTGKLVPRASE